MMCSQDGEAAMLRTMLEHGAQVNTRSGSGETALMYAAITGNLDIVKILLRCVYSVIYYLWYLSLHLI